MKAGLRSGALQHAVDTMPDEAEPPSATSAASAASSSMAGPESSIGYNDGSSTLARQGVSGASLLAGLGHVAHPNDIGAHTTSRGGGGGGVRFEAGSRHNAMEPPDDDGEADYASDYGQSKSLGRIESVYEFDENAIGAAGVNMNDVKGGG
jgi:hypothetical protein